MMWLSLSCLQLLFLLAFCPVHNSSIIVHSGGELHYNHSDSSHGDSMLFRLLSKAHLDKFTDHEKYKLAIPYPHIVLDDLFPKGLIDNIRV